MAFNIETRHMHDIKLDAKRLIQSLADDIKYLKTLDQVTAARSKIQSSIALIDARQNRLNQQPQYQNTPPKRERNELRYLHETLTKTDEFLQKTVRRFYRWKAKADDIMRENKFINNIHLMHYRERLTAFESQIRHDLPKLKINQTLVSSLTRIKNRIKKDIQFYQLHNGLLEKNAQFFIDVDGICHFNENSSPDQILTQIKHVNANMRSQRKELYSKYRHEAFLEERESFLSEMKDLQKKLIRPLENAFKAMLTLRNSTHKPAKLVDKTRQIIRESKHTLQQAWGADKIIVVKVAAMQSVIDQLIQPQTARASMTKLSVPKHRQLSRRLQSNIGNIMDPAQMKRILRDGPQAPLHRMPRAA